MLHWCSAIPPLDSVSSPPDSHQYSSGAGPVLQHFSNNPPPFFYRLSPLYTLVLRRCSTGKPQVVFRCSAGKLFMLHRCFTRCITVAKPLVFEAPSWLLGKPPSSLLFCIISLLLFRRSLTSISSMLLQFSVVVQLRF